MNKTTWKVKIEMKEEKDKSEGVEILLKPINIKTITVKIKGTTPLIMQKFTAEAQKEILDKQTGVAQGAKNKIRDLKKEAEKAIHKTSTGKIGFPEYGFKKGMVECTSFVGDKAFSKKLISGAVQIVNVEDGLIPITFKSMSVLEHRIKNNTLFSPSFFAWACDLVVKFDANNIGPSDIVTLINYAGYYQGVGSWRPKGRDGGSGTYGMYEVVIN